ncbi:NUDIX domain-containing protein [Phytohabitans kaempferiae]|uniref:NUDIX domain-containing protein n=1 Tax=Phytohabitans kaempferiae TaxID=1620943 RepID=A0ABV6MCK6_9ACTN
MTASAAVFDPAREMVLLAIHNVTKYWQFPGGHLEDQESAAEAAIREVHEETGVHATLWTSSRIEVPGGRWQPSPILTVEYPAPANPRWNEPEHVHVDLLYMGTADSLAHHRPAR